MFKKTLLSFFTLFMILGACSPTSNQIAENQVCCDVSANSNFAKFASDKDFINSHDNPLPMDYTTDIGKAITFKATDGTDAGAFEFKAEGKSNKVVFVFHEWWGLNDYIKKESESIYNSLDKKVTVIAIDLYDGKVATDKENASAYMQGAKPERIKAIMEGAMAYVGTKAKIGTIGWCFGGSMSLQASLVAKKQAVACVIYYGMPEKDVEKLKNLNAEVLGIFAGREKWITTEIVDQFTKDLNTLGKKNTVKSYDAEHAFANPSNPNHNKEYSAEAYQMSIDFFKSKF